jgi:hypothetical protein
LTHLKGAGLKLGKESDRGMGGALADLEEEVRGLQQLVCELLIVNQELRCQFAESDSEL